MYLKNLMLLSTAFIAVLAILEILHRGLGMKGIYTRSLAQISTGVICLSLPFLIQTHWEALFLCGLFSGILCLSLRFGILRSIHQLEQSFWESLSLPWLIYGCFWAFAAQQPLGLSYLNPVLFFYIPVQLITISYPIIQLVSKTSLNIEGKSASKLRAFLFFCSAFTFAFAAMYVFDTIPTVFNICIALAIAFCVSIGEFVLPYSFKTIGILALALAVLWTFNRFFTELAL